MEHLKITYRELLMQNKDQVEKEALQFEVEEAEQTLNATILETKKALSRAKKNLSDTVRKRPYNPQSIIEAELVIEELEDGLVRLEKQKALFAANENSNSAKSES